MLGGYSERPIALVNASILGKQSHVYTPGFLSGFGPRGGKTAICNLVGGHGSLNMHST